MILDRVSLVAKMIKNQPTKAGDVREVGSIPGSGPSLGGGHGIQLQYSCLGNPMDCSLPGSAFHGILQVRRVELVAISFSRGSSQPRD